MLTEGQPEKRRNRQLYIIPGEEYTAIHKDINEYINEHLEEINYKLKGFRNARENLNAHDPQETAYMIRYCDGMEAILLEEERLFTETAILARELEQDNSILSSINEYLKSGNDIPSRLSREIREDPSRKEIFSSLKDRISQLKTLEESKQKLTQEYLLADYKETHMLGFATEWLRDKNICSEEYEPDHILPPCSTPNNSSSQQNTGRDNY